MSHSLPRQYSVSSGSEAHASGNSAPIVQTNCDVTASFEELFGVLTQPTNEHIKRWSDRNLPNSFYNEPSDSRHGTRSPIGTGIRHQSPKRTANGLPVVHSRSVSSPANLVQSLTVKTTPQHSRQNSFDGFLDSAPSPADLLCAQQQQQPQAAWPEAAVKYPRYSGDSAISADNSSSLLLPQIGCSLQQNVSAIGRQNKPGHHFQHPEFSSPESLPLPPGWEMGVSPDGEVYYIDHNTKSTSWTHPALPQARISGTPQFPSTAQRQSCSPLSSQQHIKTAVPSAASVAPPVDGRRAMSNEQLIQMQLQQLHKEKMRILREQEAILMKEKQLAELMKRSAVISSPTAVPNDSMLNANAIATGNYLPITRPASSNISAGHDTFQIQNPLAAHSLHVRQSSGDSGLGGMGATYSLSRTPEDYLCNVDEGMDIHEGRLGGKNMPLNLNDASLFGAQMDFGSLLDPSLDNDIQLVSAFNDMHGDLGCSTDIDMQSGGGQTWL